MNAIENHSPPPPAHEVLTFGRFRLDPVQHVLHEDDKPLHLGSRALEILIVLAERTGEVVTKNELLARVWPKSVVQEATLRVHIAALRKVLGSSEYGTRYVENFSGRGYRFIGPVIRRPIAPLPPTPATTPQSPSDDHRAQSPPHPLTRIIGRSQTVACLAARIQQYRFITVVGPGGIGKSALVAPIAERLSDAYEHGVHVIDCSAVSNPHLLPHSLALMLDLAPVSETGALHAVLSHLRHRSMLIVLDNCEGVVEGAATLAERVLQVAPGVNLLATSREPLRAECEYVHRLAPLAAPAPLDTMTHAEALSFPAIQLFVERASAYMDSFELHQDELPLLAQICARLEGNPLAIELAAARVDLFGVRGLAARLTDSLRLLTRGRRTAPPRHRSLRATLDWSYQLLAPLEQAVLRRLALFSGPFDMEAANIVTEDGEIRAAELFDTLSNLAAKSILVSEVVGACTLYRLPEATREHAFEKLHESDEVGRTLLLHAETWVAPETSAAQSGWPFGGDRKKIA
jgi:predicted ATPase/DNA-binding winged helix-turn-helix (wHTH) protein